MIESRQLFREYGDISFSYSFNGDTLEDFQALKDDIFAITDIINNPQSTIYPQFGSGSPEGVVFSNASRTYFDTSGGNATMYINETIGSNTGWQQVN